MIETVWPKKLIALTSAQEKAREEFMMAWHQELPSKYKMIENFNHGYPASLPIKKNSVTLEIGAGLGAHAAFEDLKNQDYFQMEYREDFCKELRKKFDPSKVVCGDIQGRLPFEDGIFDRIIAIHVLEHLPDLPKALTEIKRLMKPDGVFDVVLPCEGGLAYSLARKISAERMFKKRFKMDYGPIIKNEHVSTYSEILREIDENFQRAQSRYFPLMVPISTLNLVVGTRLTKKSS